MGLDVEDIVRSFLLERNFGGLIDVESGECACEIDSLFRVCGGSDCIRCVPAYRNVSTKTGNVVLSPQILSDAQIDLVPQEG